MSEKPIKLYSLSTCSHCKSTKKFLSDCTILYEFVDVDLLEGEERQAILEDVKKFNPKCSFPTIIIGDTVIVGFKEEEIKEALGARGIVADFRPPDIIRIAPSPLYSTYHELWTVAQTLREVIDSGEHRNSGGGRKAIT